MSAPSSAPSISARLGDDLSPPLVLACAAAVYVAGWAFLKSGGSYFPGGLFDEAAHFATALLLLQGLPPRLRRRIARPALFASVAIDLDHLPAYLGHDFLMVGYGSARPATHSLVTPLVLLALALALRRHRRLFLGLALGVALHFFRDLAEGNGSGVPLLWPLSDHAFSYPHATYLVLIACVVAADLILAILSPRVRVATR